MYVERELATEVQLEAWLVQARNAQREWRHVPLAQRAALCTKLVDALVADTPAIAEELTWQIGRPLRYTPGELRGLAAHGCA